MSFEVVQFTTNGGSAPTAFEDDGKILGATPFTVTATGRIKLNLKDRWRAIYSVCDMDDATPGDGAENYGRQAGMTADNYVEIKTVDGAALADTTGKVVTVFLALSR